MSWTSLRFETFRFFCLVQSTTIYISLLVLTCQTWVSLWISYIFKVIFINLSWSISTPYWYLSFFCYLPWKIFVLHHLVNLKQVQHDIITSLTSVHKALTVELEIIVGLFHVVIGRGCVSIQGREVVLVLIRCFLRANDWLLHEEFEKHGPICLTLHSKLLPLCHDFRLALLCSGSNNTLVHLNAVLSLAVMVIDIGVLYKRGYLPWQVALNCWLVPHIYHLRLVCWLCLC